MLFNILPGWVWLVGALLVLGEIHQIIRPYNEWPRFRCHQLGGIVVLLLILIVAPLVQALTDPGIPFSLWFAAFIAGLIAGYIIARWVQPILFHSEKGLFYQAPDFWGLGIIAATWGLQWYAYYLMALTSQADAMLLTTTLSGQALLAGFMIARNVWYIHEYHNVRIIVPR